MSFLSCSLNPVGAAGLAMRILKPHDMYSTPLGWAMTAGSFVIAVMGFIATERVAYLERHRRALEIASLLTCGAAVLAFALGFTLPMIVMWPIAAVLVAVGGLGFRGATSLPVPVCRGLASSLRPAQAAQSQAAEAQASRARRHRASRRDRVASGYGASDLTRGSFPETKLLGNAKLIILLKPHRGFRLPIG